MNKIQNWKIKNGEQYIGRDVQEVLGDKAELRLLHQDGYAGRKFLDLSDNSVWEEVYIWESGIKSVTTVKLNGTEFHEGRISYVSALIPIEKNCCEVYLKFVNVDCRKKLQSKGYELLHRKDSGFYVLTDNLDECLLDFNMMNIPFGVDSTLMSPQSYMRLLKDNGVLKCSFQGIYYGCSDFTITINSQC